MDKSDEDLSLGWKLSKIEY